MKATTYPGLMIPLTLAAGVMGGCSQTQLIFRPAASHLQRPAPVGQQAAPDRLMAGALASPAPVQLASKQATHPSEPVAVDPPIVEADSPVDETDRPVEGGATAQTPVEDAPAEVTKSVAAYTAPPVWVQRVVFQVVSALTDGASDRGAGKEVSESVIYSESGVLGRVGLTAPPTFVDDGVVIRPGSLQQRFSGIGFGSPNNIHMLQRNPASGLGGRCNELASAGFPVDHRACGRGVRSR